MTKPQPALRHSSKVQEQHPLIWWVSILSLALLTFALFIQSAAAQIPEKPPVPKLLEPHQQAIQYDVYAGGLHALQANLDIDMAKKKDYSLQLSAKTYGLLGKLAPWHGTFESHGWKPSSKDGLHMPKLHQSTTTFRDELEVKKYHYNKDGSFKEYSIMDEHSDGSPREVDDELTQGTSDVLSATLNMMQNVVHNNKCEGTSEIFDGKRRYKLIFQHKEDVILDASRWNVYAGPAIKCTVEVQPLAGKWYEKPRGWMSIQEQGKERGTMPTIWMAKMTQEQPAVPVKVRVKTSYGTLFMHMTHYHSHNKKLALAD